MKDGFRGMLGCLASVLPATGVDDRLYDNRSEALVNVTGGSNTAAKIYTPYLRRK